MEKDITIRNSTAEFLIIRLQHPCLMDADNNGVNVLSHNGRVWVTQKTIVGLFGVSISTIKRILDNIFEEGELEPESTIIKRKIVRQEGNRHVFRTLKFYNLDVIISIGFRLNSVKAIQFRQWCTSVLRQVGMKGFAIDQERMENGQFLDDGYFECLLDEITEIRFSGRSFYQKITDLYATSLDYDHYAPTTVRLYKRVSNEMVQDDDGQGESDAKCQALTSLLNLAEQNATHYIPMTMEDWARVINHCLDCKYITV